VIQQAQSGTGKTATFCAGILNNLDFDVNSCQALVLAPTRELAQQIDKVMRHLGEYVKAKSHACVGGTSVRDDANALAKGVHVVVGTPGRVFDMLRRGALRADTIKMFVLDEADEMLSRGFKDQIYDIFRMIPGQLQVRPPFAPRCAPRESPTFSQVSLVRGVSCGIVQLRAG
jgi:translation initiation factor 4A